MLGLFGSFASRLPGHAGPDSVRDDDTPIRSELFSVERLEQHAHSLAANQPVYRGKAAGKSLVSRLRDHEPVRPLPIGELGAVAITRRFVRIETLPRWAGLIGPRRAEGREADLVPDRLLGPREQAPDPAALASVERMALSDSFVVQL